MTVATTEEVESVDIDLVKTLEALEKSVAMFYSKHFKCETLQEAFQKFGVNDKPVWEDFEFETEDLTERAAHENGDPGIAAADFAREEYTQFESGNSAFVREATYAQRFPDTDRSATFSRDVSELIDDAPNARFRRQNRIGRPGTNLIAGKVAIEQNKKMEPFRMRGRRSKPGLELEIYRSEPLVFRHVNEIKSLSGSAIFPIVIPKSCDEKTRELIERIDRDIKNIETGFDDWIDVASMGIARHAFWVGEKIYDFLDDGYVKIVAAEHRDQSTVESWLTDSRITKLAGVEFSPSTTQAFNVSGLKRSRVQAADTYVIPAGKTPRTARLIHIALNGEGLNFEGNGPVRVVTGFTKLKQLVLNSHGVAFQKWSVPIPLVKRTAEKKSAFVVQEMGSGDKKPRTQTELLNDLDAFRSRLGLALDVPSGFEVEFLTPTGQIPDPVSFLEYIDLMISIAFSNEGAMLGQNNFGSFAMARVADSKFLRSADVYVREVAKMLTKIMRDLLRWNHPDPDSIPEQPFYNYKFQGANDSAAWIATLIQIMDANPHAWPEKVREATATEMGLDRDAFNDPNGAALIESVLMVMMASPNAWPKEVRETVAVSLGFKKKVFEDLLGEVENADDSAGDAEISGAGPGDAPGDPQNDLG